MLVVSLVLGCWSGRHVETTLVERELLRAHRIERDGIELAARIGGEVTLLAREHTTDVLEAQVEIEEWQERTAKLVIGKRRRLLSTTSELRELERTPRIGEQAPWTGALNVHAVETSTAWSADGHLQVVEGRLMNPGEIPTAPLHHPTATVRFEAGGPLLGTDEASLYRALAGLALADPSIGEGTVLRQTWAWWYTPQAVRIGLDRLLLPAVSADPFTSREPEPFVRLSVGDVVAGCTRVIGNDLPAGAYDLAAAYEGEVRRADLVRIDVMDADLKAHDLLWTTSSVGVPAASAAGWVVLTVGEPGSGGAGGLGSCKKGLDQVMDAVGVAMDVVRGAQTLVSCLEEDVGLSPLGTIAVHMSPEAGRDLEPILHWLDAQAWLVGVIPRTEDNAAALELLDVVNMNSNAISLGLCLVESTVGIR